MADHLLPPNTTQLERDLEATLAKALTINVPVEDLWHAYRCPFDFLPWLAWAVGVEEWDSTWPEAVKRDVISATPDIRRHRGTVWAVREALRAAGYADAYIEEGMPCLTYNGEELYNGEDDYSGGSRWALFRVIADIGENIGVSGSERERLVRLVSRAKPVRSVLREVAYQASVSDSLEMGDEHQITVKPTVDEVRPAGRRYDGSITHSQAEKLPREATYFDGCLRHNGYADYDGLMPHHEWQITGETYSNQWDETSLHLAYQAADAQRVALSYSGAATYDGAPTHGEGQPSMVDAGVATVVERRKHNARLSFNGQSRYAGTSRTPLAI